MKILITGITARHTGHERNRFLTVIQPTILALKSMGHEVSQGIVSVDDDLSLFDKIIVYMFPIEKMGATRRYGVFDTIKRYPEKIIVSFDDWQYFQIQDSFRQCVDSFRFWGWAEEKPQFITPTDNDRLKRKYPDDKKIYKKEIEKMVMDLSQDLKFPVIMPVFTWSKKYNIRLFTTGKIFHYDPSRFAIDHVEKNYTNLDFPPAEKNKAWVLGSLFDHSNYIRQHEFTWPVAKYGWKKEQVVLYEEELCNIYNSNWGIISPKYRTSGDGWWRARWIFTYMFDCILHCSQEELGDLYEDFVPPLYDIENASDDKLKQMAKYQKETLEEFFMKKDQVCSILQEALNA